MRQRLRKAGKQDAVLPHAVLSKPLPPTPPAPICLFTQMLLYTSELKQPHTVPRKDKQQLVDALVEK